MKNPIVIILFVILITSCAQRIKVPINRLMTPETIGGGLGVEYQKLGFSRGQLDFSNNNTDNPLLMDVVSENSFHTDLGVVDRMDIFIDVPKESSTKVGVKVQILGDPEKVRKEGHLLAFTLATGTSQDTFESGWKVTLKSELQDYSIIHGYRFNEHIMVYDGIYVTSYSFDGKIENATSLSSDTIDIDAQNILGANLGLVIGATGIKLKTEIAAQQITWTNTETKQFYSFATALAVWW